MARIVEAEFRQIVQIYEEMASSCVSGLERFYEDITDLSRKTAYEPLVIFTNKIYEFYMGEFRRHLLDTFHDWYDSGYSLHALVNQIRGGTDAYHNAKRYMDDIEQYVEGLFRLSASEVRCDTSEPMIENEDFDTFKEAIKAFTRCAEEAKISAVSRTQQMASDNDAFVCIIPYVRTTGQSMIESFDGMIQEVEDGLGLFGTGVRKSRDDAESQREQTLETSLPWDSNLTFL